MGQQQPNGTIAGIRKFPGLNLRARLAAAGPAFGLEMADLTALLTLVETKVNVVIVALGGASAIDPAGEWGWVIPYITAGTFALPSNPFTFTIVAGSPPTPVVFTVTISVDSSGNATVAYSTASGPYTGPDPL